MAQNFQSYIKMDAGIYTNLSDKMKHRWKEAMENFDVVLLPDNSYLVHHDIYEEIISEIQMDNKDPYGIKNVNFTLIEPSDKRWEEYKQQRLEQGFDNSELWNLDSTIARFIAPRIKEFGKHTVGVPGKIYWKYTGKDYIDNEEANKLAQDEWDEILDEIIWTFENYEHEPSSYMPNYKEEYEKYTNRIANGLKLFAEYFGCLNY